VPKATCDGSLDHLVGADEQLWRHFEVERIGRLEVDGKLVFLRAVPVQTAARAQSMDDRQRLEQQ
jgi:hypothetical protein